MTALILIGAAIFLAGMLVGITIPRRPPVRAAWRGVPLHLRPSPPRHRGVA